MLNSEFVRSSMRLSVEILDHIFSFLVSHRETLIACSKDPVLSPIVDRHLYYHVVVTMGFTDPQAFEPNQFAKLVSEHPRILYYVRILQIQVDDFWRRNKDGSIIHGLDEFAQTLLLFPILESIMLVSKDLTYEWSWSDTFRAALEDRLKLPTVKELHLICSYELPFSVLDNCKNIKHLSLSGDFLVEDEFCDSVLPRLESLTLFTHSITPSLLTWVKLHTRQLQSLTCAVSSIGDLPELLGGCSETLRNLELDLGRSPYLTEYTYKTGEIRIRPLPELSPIPPNLQQLTIRALVCLPENGESVPNRCVSWLQAAAEAITIFTPSLGLGHLILDIDLDLFTFAHFTNVDFSPLAVLGPASLSIPRIDLYVHTGIFPSSLTRAQLLSSLGEYEDILRSIEEGILVVHSEKTAPRA